MLMGHSSGRSGPLANASKWPEGAKPVASASALPDPFRPFKPHAVDDRLGRLAVSWRLRGVSVSDPTEADVQDNDQNHLRKKCFKYVIKIFLHQS